MTVTLKRAYSTYATGAVVTLPDSTETALIAQGLATAGRASSTVPAETLQLVTQGGNSALMPNAGQSTNTSPTGPSIIPVVPLTAFAAAGTSNVHVAGTLHLSEVYVPARATFTGIGVLNGTIVGTDNMLVALYDSAGALVANSAVAGALSAGANAFQNVAFTAVATLEPGRYFLGVQMNGATATTRKLKAADSPNVLTRSSTGTFGTIPATVTVPTAFVDVAGVISYLYV